MSCGSDDFRIRTRFENRTTIIDVAGTLDLCSSHTFREKLRSAMESNRPWVVIDFSRLSLIDSTGLAVIAATARRAKLSGTKLAIVCRDGRVRTTLELTGFHKVVPVFSTCEEALGDIAAT